MLVLDGSFLYEEFECRNIVLIQMGPNMFCPARKVLMPLIGGDDVILPNQQCLGDNAATK